MTLSEAMEIVGKLTLTQIEALQTVTMHDPEQNVWNVIDGFMKNKTD